MRRCVRWVLGFSLPLAVVLATMAMVAASATPLVTTTRLHGQDRYATAAAIATATFDTSLYATLARGEDFPDALAASTAAGRYGGPILLTPSDHLHPAALAAMRQMGVTTVALVGGTSALSPQVETELRDAGMQTVRYAGADRFDTAYQVFASCSFECVYGPLEGKRTALVASGYSFPDALAAAPIAYRLPLPVLLVTKDTVPDPTARALQQQTSGQRAIEKVLLLGGTDVVSAQVEDRIRSMGILVERIAGATRQETATRIADFERTRLNWIITHVNLARGDTFPDALAGGPHAGSEGAPVLLTADPTTLSDVTRAYLRANAATIGEIDVFGDASAISDAVVDDARQAASGT